MRKNSIVLCCVTVCLLCAVPENQGSKLLESLNCIRPYPLELIICTWVQNDFTEKLVNLTLVEVLDDHIAKNVCTEKNVTRNSPTDSNWTCHIPTQGWSATDNIIFSFVPERNLETRLNTMELRDEGKPQNLQCYDTDENVTCSWQVRKEIAESIDFNLFYNNGENECQPTCQQEMSEYLFCHCNIMNDVHLDTSTLTKTISVKPRKPKNSFKSFKLCLIYQLPPINLVIKEIKAGEVFFAIWNNTVTDSKFRYQYDLCYWNQNDLQLEEVPDKCPGRAINISHNHDRSVKFEIGMELNPSTNYSMAIRVRLNEKSNYCYQGPWSQWSDVQTLTTKAVPNLILLYVLVPMCVIALVIFALYGYKALVRYKKQWDERIPNPNKSSIIKGLQKTKDRLTFQNGSGLHCEDHLYVEPYNIMMCTASDSKASPHVYHNEERINRFRSESSGEEDAESFILCDVTKEDYPTASIVDEYKPFPDLTNEEESNDINDSQFTFSAFDGPYLFSESNV